MKSSQSSGLILAQALARFLGLSLTKAAARVGGRIFETCHTLLASQEGSLGFHFGQSGQSFGKSFAVPVPAITYFVSAYGPEYHHAIVLRADDQSVSNKASAVCLNSGVV